MALIERHDDELPIGPARLIVFKSKHMLSYKDRAPITVPSHCVPVLKLLAKNTDDEVPLDTLNNARSGKTSLIQTIAEIRKLLTRLGIYPDFVDIPPARPDEGYILRFRSNPKRQPAQNTNVPETVHHQGAKRELQQMNSTSIEAQLDIFDSNVRTPSAIKVFPTWGEADIAVINAQSTVTIIDSYYDEHFRLEWLLGAMRNRDCVVSIYMATPGMDFGAQRQREWETVESENYAEVLRKLNTIVSDKERSKYESDFEKICDDIMRCAKKKNIKCELSEYPVMLSLRFIVVDDKEIIWGWFPLFDSNPNYPCLYLLWEESLSETDKNLFNKLKSQIEHVKSISVSRVSFESRHRRNFHRNLCKKMAASNRVQAKGKASSGRLRQK